MFWSAANLRVRLRAPLSLDRERLVADMSTRPAECLSRGQRHGEALVIGTFLVAAGALALLSDDPRPLPIATAIALVVVLSLTARVEIQLGSGYAVPTEIFVVPLVLLTPVPWAAPLVALALVLSRAIDVARGQLHVQRVLLGVSDAWFVIGPVTVLAIGGVRGVHWQDWPWWCAALAAQLLVDTGVSSVSERLRAGRRSPLVVPDAAVFWFVDVALAPIAVLVAFAAAAHPAALLMPVPLIVLVAALAEERRARLAQALDLSHAYQGVARVLGEAIEADDGYTGQHSTGVVWLSLSIADHLRLDEWDRRLVEFGALLHDVGKMSVPNEIINKPGALTDDEWAVIRLHTVTGQDMLDKVGGVMTDVGVVVRASHERMDGTGYPDGLAGEDIPLPARIVACADAVSAMTTDRPYRRAMPTADAIAELRANAGSQFDPRVVEAAITVIHAGDATARPESQLLSDAA